VHVILIMLDVFYPSTFKISSISLSIIFYFLNFAMQKPEHKKNDNFIFISYDNLKFLINLISCFFLNYFQKSFFFRTYKRESMTIQDSTFLTVQWIQLGPPNVFLPIISRVQSKRLGPQKVTKNTQNVNDKKSFLFAPKKESLWQFTTPPFLQCNEFNWAHPTFFCQWQSEFRKKDVELRLLLDQLQ